MAQRFSSLVTFGVLACGALLACSTAAAAEDVVLVAANSDGHGPTARWTGEVVEYSGRELRMRMPGGREKVFPGARVVSIETTHSAEQQAGDEAFAKADFRRALERYRAALDGDREPRQWVRRQILSQIVWCQRALDAWEPACEFFLLLAGGDRGTPYFDCIPLVWTPQEPSPGLEQKAKRWLAKGELASSALLGASHLLSTAERPAALEALNRLASDRDPRIALLAQAQIWRTTSFQAGEAQFKAWRTLLEKIPEPLRAGAYFTLGSALARKEPEQAVPVLLRVPLLYGRERQLSARALLLAGNLLDQLERGPEAAVLYAELLQNYAERPEAQEARRKLSGAVPALPPASAAAVPSRDSLDERFVAALRQRRLFALAESFCRARLEDPELSDTARVELVDELARTLAEQALATAPDQREPFWRSAAQALTDFVRKYPQNPRLPLVRMQAALVAVGRAELARQESEIGAHAAGSTEQVRAGVRGAIAELKQLNEDLVAELRRRGRPGNSATSGQLTEAELTSLQANVRYQLARALRNQGLCYPPESADRVSALTQAAELLGPLGKADDDDPLAWPSRVDEIVCLRQSGKLADATRTLIDLGKAKPPEAIQHRLRAEGVRLLLAKGRLDEALAAAGPADDALDAGAAELDFARLEALVALWQRAAKQNVAEQNGAGQTAEWEKKAAAQVTHIEGLHGPYWMRRAETLLAGTLAKAARAESLDSLTRAAVSYYRGGQIDEALAAYDEARAQAEGKSQPDAAFEIGLTAAAIEHQRKHFAAAVQRFQQLALSMPEHPKAAETHLAAIHDAAEAAQADPALLADYRKLLAEHLEHFAESPTAGQAAWWLARLEEHDGKWLAAATAYRGVPADNAQYAASVEGAARAYQRLLAQQRADGKPNAELAREAAKWLEQVALGPGGSVSKSTAPWSPLARQAGLDAARLWLAEVPDGAVQAEDVLNSTLAGSSDAPAEWQSSARSLLVAALAAQGRIDEAAAALEKISGGTPTDLLPMLEGLVSSSAQVGPQLRRELAQLELKTLDALGDRTSKLPAAERRRLERIRGQALADAGRRAEALKLCESLARQNPGEGQLQVDYAELLSQSTAEADQKLALAKWREVSDRTRTGSPRYFRAYLGMIEAQLALGNRRQARTLLKLVEANHADFGGGDLRRRFEDAQAKIAK